MEMDKVYVTESKSYDGIGKVAERIEEELLHFAERANKLPEAYNTRYLIEVRVRKIEG